MELVGQQGQNGPFTKSNESQSRPWLWIQLVEIAKMAHLQDQTSPREDLRYGASWTPRPKRPIYKVKRASEKITTFYGDVEFRSHFGQKHAWNFVKTLAMDPVSRHGENNPFTRSNDPQSSDPEFRRHLCQKLTWTSVKTLDIDPVRRHNQKDTFTTSNEPQSTVVPVWRHCKKDPFTSSNEPREGKSLILPIFMCYSPRHFMVTQNFEVIFANNLHGPLLRP
ncbi:hypothetical protein H5410_049305 [Solanum commersonii]|uniref:Uncharacterized protein n=1 Tax=Solanum commersonii TaxID=4109 RepID=A0A9J5WUQ3_SOLCO|nr:hypothetical protein H5410_049305 [Solanum commersonii]